MTGFAQARGEAEGSAFVISAKSVNHRFLDLRLRLPSEVEALTPVIERRVRQHLRRGHVELSASFEQSPALDFKIDQRLAQAYFDAHHQLSSQFGIADSRADIDQILRYPGVLTLVPRSASGGSVASEERAGDTGPSDPFSLAFLDALERCLEQLNRVRSREGAALVADLRQRVEHLQSSVAEIGNARPVIEQQILRRLRERMTELIAGSVPEERLLQEAALAVERSDISEEITRFQTHLGEFLAILDEGGETGKKLDFLLQELNREVNTMLSKTAGVAELGLRVSSLGISMKTEIEKIREQVQNLE